MFSKPERSAAINSASQPPLRCARNASGVTGIILSPAVVPDVVTQYRGRPRHVRSRSPLIARLQIGWNLR
jgi:hypothetical protein